MATKKVNIDIVAKDKSKQALNKVQSNLDVVKKSAFNLKNALIGIGTALAVRSVLQTTAEFEDLRDSLDSVTGSIRSGGEAFKFISDFRLLVESLKTSVNILSTESFDIICGYLSSI